MRMAAVSELLYLRPAMRTKIGPFTDLQPGLDPALFILCAGKAVFDLRLSVRCERPQTVMGMVFRRSALAANCAP